MGKVEIFFDKFKIVLLYNPTAGAKNLTCVANPYFLPKARQLVELKKSKYFGQKVNISCFCSNKIRISLTEG